MFSALLRASVVFMGVAVCGTLDVRLVASTQGESSPELTQLLDMGARYVAQLEAAASGMVFEERYVQDVSRRGSSTSRRLRSEMLVVGVREKGWMAFRNVLEVDGKAVPDRQERLATLFATSSASALAEARVIADESARFNLGSVERNLNYPTMALMFLRRENQSRSEFYRAGSDRVDGVQTWVVGFRETARPTLIGSRGADVASSGRFWIEPDTGRIRRAELTVEEETSIGTFDVVYREWSGLDVLMPRSMEEDVTVRAHATNAATGGRIGPLAVELIRGRAQYSNYRQFAVDVRSSVPSQ